MTRSPPFRITAAAFLVVTLSCTPSHPMACEPWGTAEQVADRPSPFDSAMASHGGAELKLCYSRPSARGRQIFGDLVPFDTLWRTGANEATVLHLSADATVAGISVEAGKYSLYTVPSPDQWMVVLNASTGQWGLTRDERGARGNLFLNAYTPEVRSREIDRRPIEVRSIPFVETLAADFFSVGPSELELWIDWETTRLVIPIQLSQGSLGPR